MSQVATRKGRKPRYTRESIVQAAVNLADEHGLEAVTMARVAGQIGCTPMALYSHVENHDALLRAMADQVLEELDGDFSHADWQLAVRQWLRVLWTASQKRQWLVEVILVNDRITLQWLKFNEQLVEILESAGMQEQQIAESLTMIGCIGVSAIFQVTKFPLPRSGVVVDGIGNERREQLNLDMWSRLLPHLASQSNDGFLQEVEDWILMGLQAKINRGACS